MKLMQRLSFVLAALLFLALASAQDLATLLPADTIFALGTQDLSASAEKLEGFTAEFERLELADAFAVLFADATDDMEVEAETEGFDELEAFVDEVDVLELFGQEAWLAVSATPEQPLPAVTLVTRLGDEVTPKVTALLEDIRTKHADSTESLTEGETTFYVETLEDMDEPAQEVAYAQVDNLLVVSNSSEALRGVLRRAAGAGEAGFMSSTGYQATLGTLEPGNFYSYLDYTQIAQAAKPFAAGLGLDALIDQLARAFTTAGTVGSVVRLTDEGIVSESVQAVNPAGGDEALYTLLTTEAAADLSAVRFAPAEALSYSVTAADFAGWWSYLGGLVSSVPQLGMDLDTLVMSFTGVDLKSTFFDWAGNQLVTVTTGLGEPVEPGVPADNLLGESAYLIESTNAAEATEGLQQLFGGISRTLAMFSDPSGGMGSAETSTQEINGVSVTSFDITDGVSISYAVLDDYVVIATADEAMQAVLAAQASGQTLASGGTYEALSKNIPEGVHSVTYSNAQATLENLATQLSSQFQMMAGLGGAADLDFEAVGEASAKVEEFLLYVASRLGDSISYSERSPEGIYSYGEMSVDW